MVLGASHDNAVAIGDRIKGSFRMKAPGETNHALLHYEVYPMDEAKARIIS